MKTTIYILLMSLVVMSCTCTNTNTNRDLHSIPVCSIEKEILMSNIIDKGLTTFIKYKSFDEYTLKGIGQLEEGKEYVEVAHNDSCILVKCSNLPDSIICYRQNEGIWTNIIVRNWEKRNNGLIRDVFDEPATIYYRIVGNDSIIEYSFAKIQDVVLKNLYIKRRNDCVKISLFPEKDILNMSNPYPELKKILHQYNTNPDSFMEERDKYGDNRSIIKYKKEISENKVILSCGNKEDIKQMAHYYVFIMNPIGELSIQPGFEKYKRELSWCRDIIEGRGDSEHYSR